MVYMAIGHVYHHTPVVYMVIGHVYQTRIFMMYVDLVCVGELSFVMAQSGN